jgi:hypothetical protein
MNTYKLDQYDGVEAMIRLHRLRMVEGHLLAYKDS